MTEEIIWSNKFKLKFWNSIDYINRQLKSVRKRLKKIGSAEELPSPLARFGKFWSASRWQAELIELTRFGDLRVFELADTNSMDPLFDADHKLLAMPVIKTRLEDESKAGLYHISKIQVGDVLLFRRFDPDIVRNVVHRCIDIRTSNGRKQFKTLGDNVTISDGWTDQKYVDYVAVGVLW